MAKMSNWEPYSRYVQGGMIDGKFMNASFTMLAAGPPRLAAIGGGSYVTPGSFGGEGLSTTANDDVVFPLGIVQNFSMGHSKSVNRLFEVGSDRSFFITGHTMGQVSLSRVMYHGPSILRVMYAYYEDNIPPTVKPLMGAGARGFQTVQNRHDVQIPAGYENLYLNLASDLFSQPTGLMAYFRDSNKATVGAVYLESCYIPSSQISFDASNVIIQESVSVQYERMMPVAVSVPDENKSKDITEANNALALA